MFLGGSIGTIVAHFLSPLAQQAIALEKEPSTRQDGPKRPATDPSSSPTVAWFKLKPKAQEHWQLEVAHKNALKFKLLPKFSAAGPAKRIFLLFPRKSSAYNTATATLLEVFHQKGIAAEFTAINFDQENSLGRAALRLAAIEKFDLIFAMGSEATDLAYQAFQGQPIPVVSICAKDPVLLGQMPDYKTGSGTNFAFTSLNMPINVQMAYLKQLRKNLRNIAVMYDRQNKSAIETQVAPLQKIAPSAQVNIIDVAVNQDTAKSELIRAIPKAIAAMKVNDPTLANSFFWITGSTAVFTEIKTINQLAAQVPVLSAVPDVVMAGDDSAVLSVGVSFESNAYLAALYGIDILLGKAKVSDLTVGLVSPPDIAINFRRTVAVDLKVPFNFFESASFIYGYEGSIVRENGRAIQNTLS